MIPETLSQLKRKQTLTKWRLLFTKSSFDFYPTDLVNTKTTIPLRVGS